MFIELCNILALYGFLSLSAFCPTPVNPDEGTVLDEYCDGTTNVIITADGQGGEVITQQLNSEACGYVPPPSEGTVLDEYCEDPHTLVTVVADGQGGSTTNETTNSEQCGYTAPPPYGTLLREGCSEDYPGVKWFQYADGEGGTYSEKDRQSVECGWEPPTLVLELEKAAGDRFKPAIINVNYTNFLGEEEPWGMVHASTTLGHIERRGNSILAYGTGETGEGIVTLGNQEIQFTIVDEPRCGKQTPGYVPDCQGYSYSGPEKGFIYYSDDDDQIVEWELAYIIYSPEDPSQGIYHESHFTEVFEKGSNKWNEVQSIVDKYNEAYERSGIHIRYVLKEGNVGRAHYHSNRGLQWLVRTKTNADVGLGKGSTCPDTCGCAYVKTSFPENSNEAPVSRSICGYYTDLHEIGHSVGLAHGPFNSAYANSGYIWSEFGHGWESLCGRGFPDIMSYDHGERGHHNSQLTCGEMYGDIVRGNNPESWAPWDDPAGYRDYADAAYHLNRIRYDVSLINCEESKCSDAPRAMLKRDIEEDLFLVEDMINDFPDGIEMRDKELKWLQRFDTTEKLK